MNLIHRAIGTALAPRGRDQRGVSQSTEQAILLACAVGVALAIVAIVGPYVAAQLAKIGAP